MESTLKLIDPQEITENPFKLILKDWMLVTAGTLDSFNTMTAGWGGLGTMWSKNCASIVIRPTRYTYEFLERNENFTLSFFGDEYKPALNLLGSKSGRDTDKVAESGLTPVAGILPATVEFAEARMVMECRKIYFQDLDPANFLDPKIEDWYPEKDYHRLYIGEIINCLAK